MADPKNYRKFPQGSTMTPRLRATKPKPALVTDEITRSLETEADQILRASGFVETGGTGVWGPDGSRVASLDDDRAVEIPDEHESQWGDQEAVDELMDTVTPLCGLTKRETQVVRAIVSGGVWGPHAGGYARVALELGMTSEGVRKTWARARAKLVEHWAADDYQEAEITFHASCKEGNGFTVVVGEARTWGPQLDPKDRTRAVTVSTVSDADWKYEPSLDPEGWPLV